ncbi:hypothetical protein [Paenibacillus sp. KS-LC4]|uniref:hypothetical protein n=1 Tax=Paenibacillus sp. KS-LC4 TaxID=2979727 RepID=UPI0030D35B4E
MTGNPIVIFPYSGFEAFPAAERDWLAKLGEQRQIYMIAEDALPSWAIAASIAPLSLARLPEQDWDHTCALVLHPCWTHIAAPLAPRSLIAYLPDSEPQEEEQWRSYRSWLCARATLVVAATEAFYLEQAFCRGDIFLLDGTDETSDLLARQAIEWHIDGYESQMLIRLQQRFRAIWHEEQADKTQAARRLAELRMQADPTALGQNNLAEAEQDAAPQQQSRQAAASAEENPAGLPDGHRRRLTDQLFFHAVYRYLTGESLRAQGELLAAFEQAVLDGREQALQQIYRFRSAMQLELGLLDEAVCTYLHTALSEEERLQGARLLQWMDGGKPLLAEALLYQLNDDYRSAIVRLKPLQADPEARKLLAELYLQSGRLESAYLLLSKEPLRSIAEREQLQLMTGTVLLLQGKRHEAIHCCLVAAETNIEALGNIIELAKLDHIVMEQAHHRDKEVQS